MFVDLIEMFLNDVYGRRPAVPYQSGEFQSRFVDVTGHFDTLLLLRLDYRQGFNLDESPLLP
jgi:hypothetical protein